MTEAYLIAGVTGLIEPISSKPRTEQVRKTLDELLQKTGVPSGRIQELHWLGGDDEFWLSSVEGENDQMVRFQWPAGPLLAHYMLQSCVRTIESGETDLILLAQEVGGQAVLLMLASPSAVGRHNLSPRVRIGPLFSLNAGKGGLAAARAALERKGLDPGAVQWLAASRALETPSANSAFPAAQRLQPAGDVLAADLFLFNAIADRLEKGKLALLLSLGPQRSGLGTLVERI